MKNRSYNAPECMAISLTDVNGNFSFPIIRTQGGKAAGLYRGISLQSGAHLSEAEILFPRLKACAERHLQLNSQSEIQNWDRSDRIQSSRLLKNQTYHTRALTRRAVVGS